MDTIITIPKKLAKKDDLVIIPRKEYEELLRKQARQPSVALKTTPVARRGVQKEAKIIESVKTKISRIGKNLRTATGLNRKEAATAVRAGLIDSDQAWWWLESWQKRERQAEHDLKTRKVSGSFRSAKELIKDLRS